jgi:hypothetical protein
MNKDKVMRALTALAATSILNTCGVPAHAIVVSRPVVVPARPYIAPRPAAPRQPAPMPRTTPKPSAAPDTATPLVPWWMFWRPAPASPQCDDRADQQCKRAGQAQGKR